MNKMVCTHGNVKDRECRSCCDKYQHERTPLKPVPFGIFCDHCNRKSSCRICFNRYHEELAKKNLDPAPFGVFCKHGKNNYTKLKCVDPACIKMPRPAPQPKPAPTPQIRPIRPIPFEKKRHIMCIHGRRKARCSECGGNEICLHGKQRYKCKDCMGRGICIHDIQRYFCRSCGGKGICSHDRRKNECILCKSKSTAVKQDFATAAENVVHTEEGFSFLRDLGDFGVERRVEEDDKDDNEGWTTDMEDQSEFDEDEFDEDDLDEGNFDEGEFNEDDLDFFKQSAGGGNKKSCKKSNKRFRKTRKLKSCKKTCKKLNKRFGKTRKLKSYKIQKTYKN